MGSPLARKRWRRRGRQGDAPPPSPDELAKVKELLAALDTVDRTAPLYPRGSSIRQGFVADLQRKLGRLLAEVHVIELAVGPDEIEYQGEPVYDGSRAERSLSFVLDDGGVRRLAFLEGLTADEVAAFVDCLEETRSPDAEDLVTLLWSRDLQHVSYVAVNVLNDPESEGISALDLESQGKALIDRLRGRQLAIEQVAAVRAGRAAAQPANDGEEEEEAAGEVAALRLDDREQAALREWVKERRERSPALLLSHVLLGLLAAPAGAGPPDPAAERRRMAALEQGVLALVEDGDIAAAADLCARARALADPSQQATRGSIRHHGQSSPLRAFLRAVSGPGVADRLARQLQRARGQGALEGVLAYVRAVGALAFGMAGSLLGQTPHDADIMGALAEACAEDLGQLRRHVQQADARLAGAAVQILGRALGDQALDDLLAASRHKDGGVRADACRALGRCRAPRALERLVEVLDDPAPEVRSAALRSFPAFVAPPRADLYARALGAVEDDKGFDQRPEREQEGLLVALARLDPERGLALLVEWAAGRFALFGRARVKRQRLRAIAALGELASARAEEILRGLAERERDPEVGEGCRGALARLAAARRAPRATAPASDPEARRAASSRRLGGARE